MRITTNKILLIGLLLLLSVFFTTALPDLIVEELELHEEVYNKVPVYFTIHIKNVGNEPVTTDLPIFMEVSTKSYPPDDFMFLEGSVIHLVNTGWRIDSEGSMWQAPLEKIKIIEESGAERYEIPEKRTLIIPGLSGDHLEHDLNRYEENLRSAMSKSDGNPRFSDEEIIKMIERKERFLTSEKHEERFTIILNPGETAVWNSEDTIPPEKGRGGEGGGGIRFSLKEHRVEGTEESVSLSIDYENYVEEENEDNNQLIKRVIVKGSVIEGPSSGVSKAPNLEENEYFVFGQGCALIEENKICVGDDELTGDIIFSVNGEESTINKYNPIYRWFIRLVMQGRESTSVEVNGVELSVYYEGFKIKFN